MHPNLTARQARFVQEYLVDLNASAAARRAGYSEKTAYSVGQRLLKNAEVAAAVGLARSERERRTEITSDRVLRELARVAFFDPRKLFGADGQPLPIAELDDDAAAVVAGLEVSVTHNDDGSVTRVAKIKLADKLSALEKLGRHLGLFDKGTPGTAENPIAVLIRHAQGTALPVVANPPPDDDDDDDYPQAA
jgi:phage terminase small subunit